MAAPRIGGLQAVQMWCLTAPGVVVHRIRDDKSAATFTDLVGDYTGTIVCDALATHGAGARASPGVVLAGCWAHVFRKFEEAKPDHPEAEQALAWIGARYEIDARADGDLTRCGELRRTESAAVLAEFKTWLWELATLTSISIGKAAAYAIANWERLTRFVDDARIPLDNNATERAIRGPVIGRKNHYGSKSRSGTQVAATLYTLLETAKLHGVDPAAYLAAAITAADRGTALMPGTSPQRPPRPPPRCSVTPTAFASRCHDVAARGLTINHGGAVTAGRHATKVPPKSYRLHAFGDLLPVLRDEMNARSRVLDATTRFNVFIDRRCRRNTSR